MKYWLIILVKFLLLITLSINLKGQEKPPKPIVLEVLAADKLNFGAFCQGTNGGTVVIYPDGSGRLCTGDVIGLTGQFGSFSRGIIRIKGNAGTLITIQAIPDATLTGNPSGSMTLKFNNPSPVTSPASPFILPNSGWNNVYIGGTLYVKASGNPAGTYSGTFNVTFIQN